MAEPVDLIDDDFEIENTLIEPDNPQQPHLQAPPQTQVLPDGERLEQRRFTGGDTLDEPVLSTIMRDVRSFAHLLLQTVGWHQQEVASRREWDLWGPLIFCLLISLVLSIKSGSSQKSQTFSIVFGLIWVGQGMMTVNIKLLGGTVSYLHAVCITGYSLFPLLIAATFSHIAVQKLIRIPVTLVLVAWAVWSARRGLGFAGVPQTKIALAAYPLVLFYFALGWLCVLA